MKNKKPAAPPTLLVLDTSPRSESTPQLTVNLGVIEIDDGKRRVVWPKEVGGLFSENGALSWRWFRHDKGDRLTAREPRVLDASWSKPSYSRTYSIDLDEAERMVATLRTLKKRMASLREKFGQTDDFAEHVLRVAHATGAARVAVAWPLYTEATGIKRPDWATDDVDGRYWIADVGTARDVLARIARVDVTARCGVCRHPIEDGKTRCFEHGEALEHEAHRAVTEALS